MTANNAPANAPAKRAGNGGTFSMMIVSRNAGTRNNHRLMWKVPLMVACTFSTSTEAPLKS